MSDRPRTRQTPTAPELEPLFGPAIETDPVAWAEHDLGAGPVRFGLDRPNQRLKMIGATGDDLEQDEFRRLLDAVDDPDSDFDKLIVYGRTADELPWIRAGLVREGKIDDFFRDGSDAQVWVRFDGPRDHNPDEAEHFDIVMDCLEKDERVPPPVSPGYHFRRLGTDDLPRLGPMLRSAFPEYPNALDDPSLREKILTGANLFGALESSNGELAAVASAEIDRVERNAEMTDCVTDPEHRGNGLMAQLLWKLEQELFQDTRITALYTLARAGEVGMNSTFSRLGYRFTGRMLNNCRMPTGWESVNVWCRDSGLRFDGTLARGPRSTP